VIHKVGLNYKDGNHGEVNLLKKYYINSMKIAENYRIENDKENITIVFPSFITEAYRYPKKGSFKNRS